MNYLKTLALFLPFAFSITCPGTGTSSCNPGIPPNIQIAPGTSQTIPLNFDIACIPSNIEVEASAGLHITGNLNSCTLTADASFSGTGSISISWCDLSGNPGSSNSTCECLCDTTTAAPTTTTAAPTTTTAAPTTTTAAPTTTTTLPPTTTLAPTTTTAAPTTPAPTSPPGCVNGPPSTCQVNIPTEVSFCGCEGQKTFSFMFPSCSVVSYNISYGVDAGLKASVTRTDTSADVTISVEGALTGYAWIYVDWCDSTGGHGIQNTTCYVYPQENATTTPATTPAPTTPAPTSEGYQVYLSDNQKGNADYGKRDTDMKSLNIPGFASGLYYYSIDKNSGNTNVSSNSGLFGAAYQLNGPLVSFLSYFNVSGNWNMGLNPATADTSKAISLIGSCYIGLLEIMGDVNGNYTVVQETKFRNLQWEVSSVNAVSGVKYATFTGKDSNQPHFQVTITFMIAENGVTINTGAQLSPKSVEAVINILNYRFKAQESSLALQIGVGTAAYGDVSGLVEVNGYRRIVAGSGESGVYWDGATQCMTNSNGDMTDVTIVAKDVDSSQMDGAGFVSQCQQTKQAQPQITVNYTLITIVFPQSPNLTYDPSVGVDAETVKGQGNAASLHTPSSFFILILSLLALIKFL